MNDVSDLRSQRKPLPCTLAAGTLGQAPLRTGEWQEQHEAALEKLHRHEKKTSRRRVPEEYAFAHFRKGELERLFSARYGRQLPDDDAGLDDLKVMFNVIACTGGKVVKKMLNWAEVWAPWIEAETLAEKIAAKPRRFRADTMARRLGLTLDERTRLRICTIGAIDCTKEQRKEKAKQKKVEHRRLKRRANGMKPRSEYLSNALSRSKPWEAEGICRRTWERQRARVASLTPTNIHTHLVVPDLRHSRQLSDCRERACPTGQRERQRENAVRHHRRRQPSRVELTLRFHPRLQVRRDAGTAWSERLGSGSPLRGAWMPPLGLTHLQA
jgi:hypothetical protein